MFKETNELIVKSKWPETQPVDESLCKAADFMRDIMADFCARVKNFMSSKNKNVFTTSPSEAAIYMANQFPAWRKTI
ncbi:hypothetical protein OESDEN_19179 [Oesophagostomum dentatum]|uniref:Uncharacterized protein n=1 Tax=Oesophagostomum dentatum TaxID=61180 RepID=A0A0B1SD89_OESDE|nr:hypothetical protein OESDEN_19179 [Oesophagostomum dentatum]